MTAEPPIAIAEGRKDAVGMALLTMAQELWVVKDRQMVLEAMLADKDMLGDVDRYQPSAELADRLAKERQRFVTAITTLLLTGKPAEM